MTDSYASSGASKPNLGRFGSFGRGVTPQQAKEIESLGYGAVWVGGSPPAELAWAEPILEATTTLQVATGIVNIWTAAAKPVAESFHRIDKAYPGRFLLGIGVGHREAISEYRKPYDALVEYLKQLDDYGVPADRRVVAALGPRVLELSAQRSAGAHPYLTTPEHTASARSTLGEGPLLLPEQSVILCDSVDEARGIGTDWLRAYLALPNYANNLLRSGFSEDDLEHVSDRLFNAIIAWGDEDAIMRRVAEHRSAGADHVCVQVLLADPTAFPREQWRRIAAACKR